MIIHSFTSLSIFANEKTLINISKIYEIVFKIKSGKLTEDFVAILDAPENLNYNEQIIWLLDKLKMQKNTPIELGAKYLKIEITYEADNQKNIWFDSTIIKELAKFDISISASMYD